MKTTSPMRLFILYTIMILSPTIIVLAQRQVAIAYNPSNPQLQFAAEEIQKTMPSGKYYAFKIEGAKSNYQNPLWTNRVGYVDWDKIYGWVLEDIIIAKGSK